jgi:mannobiose 2-epimerase
MLEGRFGKRQVAVPDLAAARVLLGRLLCENIIPFWYPQVLDGAGGYRLNHDGDGRWKGPAPKALVAQARTLWFFARLATSPYGTPQHLAAARHGFEFLRRAFWDHDHGGFYWEVDAEGTPTRTGKHLYGQAFGLYALAEYVRAARDPAAADLARAVFEAIERHAHDGEHRGYREAFTREWAPWPADVLTCMGAPAALKLMNTHLHLMEALAAYHGVDDRPLVARRLAELVDVLSTAVVRPDGACTDRHHRDWTPLAGPDARVSYGHDCENATLLGLACDSAGFSTAPLLGVRRRLVDNALRYGFDRRRGGFFESGPLGKPADRRAKHWWVQAEGLWATLVMYRLTGEPAYADAFARTLEWIATRQADWVHGDWHAELRGRRSRGDKAGRWKAPYHNGRAVLACLDVLTTNRAVS